MYVIDFCLVKELQYNYLNNKETLELNWSSKASCDQRKGRAGRLRDGFCFRMIFGEFYYNNLLSFSSPEITRCPLEKLILKIKVWNYDEPYIILGRAIDPPLFDNITKAINNLIFNGGICISNEDNDSNNLINSIKTGNITRLGYVFAELPVSIYLAKLIMIAHSFGMIEAGIIIASILNQEKSILYLKDNTSFKERDFLDVIDMGCSSDVLMLYNLYKWWQREFNKEDLLSKEYNTKIDMRNNYNELKWCKTHYCKLNVLKEVKRTIADLKQRLNRLDIYKDTCRKIEIFSIYKEDPERLNYIIDKEKQFDKTIKKTINESKLSKKSQYIYQKDNKSYNNNNILNKVKLIENIINLKSNISNNNNNTSSEFANSLADQLGIRDIFDSNEKNVEYKNSCTNINQLINNSIIKHSELHDLIIIKIVLAGAFHGRYLNLEYIDNEKIRNANLNNNEYLLNNIKIQYVSNDVSSHNLKEFFKFNINLDVENADVYNSNANISFCTNKHKVNIDINEDEETIQKLDNYNNYFLEKKLSNIMNVINNSSIFEDYITVKDNCLNYNNFNTKYNNNNNNNNNSSSITLDNKKSYCNNLNKIKPKASYIKQVKPVDTFNYNLFKINSKSINSNLIIINENSVDKKFLVYEDINFKTDRNSIVKKCTLMPESYLGKLLLIIIFSPRVVFYSNEDNNSYKYFRINNYSSNFTFDYLFSSYDVDQINKIRKCLSKIVENNFNVYNIELLKSELISNITKLWNKKRIKIINKCYWKDLYNKYYLPKKEEEEVDNDENLLKKYIEECKSIDDNCLIESNCNNIKQINFSTDNSIKEKENSKIVDIVNDFLPPINLLDIYEDFRLFSDEGNKELIQERINYEKLKCIIEDNISKNKKLCNSKNSKILCYRCNLYITDLNCIKEIEYKQFLELIGYMNHSTNIIPVNVSNTDTSNIYNNAKYDNTLFNTIKKTDNFIVEYIKKFKILPEEFLTCKNNHVFAFRKNNKNFITNFSELNIEYPTGVIEAFNFNIKIMQLKENDYLKLRKELLKKLECEICKEYFSSDTDYLKHLLTGYHKEYLNEFLKEVYIE